MDKDFERQLEYCNVPAWHKKNIKGSGITVFMDDVGGGHAANTSYIVQAILPEATVLSGHIGVRIKNGEVYAASISCTETKEILNFEDFVSKYNVRLINNSCDGGDHDPNSPKAVWLRKMRDKYGLVLTASAGNGANQPVNNSFLGPAIIVTGCRLSDGGPVSGHYAKDDYIDFSAFTGGFVGTSFAAPFLCGLAGLLLCRYPNWKQTDIYHYFLNHSIDLGSNGKDPVYGWGLPVLGEVEDMEIVLTVGSNLMKVDGRTVMLDQAPVINPETNRTLVPIRAIAEAMGATVEWNEKAREIIIHR